MSIFDFLKKKEKKGKSTAQPAVRPVPPRPAAGSSRTVTSNPDCANIVFPVAGDAVTPEKLDRIASQQPTWFWVNVKDGTTHCRDNSCVGSCQDSGFSLCRCAKCGSTIHLNLQPDYTCKACGQKSSAYDAVKSVYELQNKAVYNRTLWPTVIRLASGLPALLAGSIGDGTDMTACQKAHDCFCINLTFRERWEKMKARGKLFPGEVEDLFTAMILYDLERAQRRQPEKNLFA